MFRKAIQILTIVSSLLATEFIFAIGTVKITNIPKEVGKIMVGVYKTQEDFEKKKVYKGFIIDAKAKTVSIKLSGLEPGWYMIAVYHDVNENGKMDFTFYGPPKEAYGFSNNAKGFFGPPSFEKAKFYYDGKTLEMTIKLGGA